MKFKPPLPSSPLLCTPQSFSRLLQSCVPAKTHRRHLLSIHALTIVSALSSDLYLNNLLLKYYSKSGLLRDARHLFDQMPRHNIISWSSMISMFSQNGHDKDALSLFSHFRKSSAESPNEFILASVFRACVQSRDVARFSQVHGLVFKSGFISDVFVGTALINCYTKVGSMDMAAIVFDELPVRNSVTWTAMITGYSQIGANDVSINLFNQMREEGVVPDRYVVSSVISACAAIDFLEGGKQIHGYVYRSGTEMDVSVNNVLVDFYCKCSKVSVARRIFNRMVAKNLVSWTTMVAGYMQNSFDSEAMILFYEMGCCGWQPDGFACTSVLNSCGALMAVKQGKQVHGYAIKGNLDSDEYVGNGLIDMYSKCDSIGDARTAFDTMIEHNVISYNAMIEGYARHEELLEAFSLFNRMRSSSLHPSTLTFISLLGVSASVSAVGLSKQIHSLVIKTGASLELYAGSALVDVYSKCSCVDDARAVFDEMDEKDLVVWNAMIFGYTQNGEGEEALRLFNQLCISGASPNEFTLVALLTAASNLASLFHGLQFHNQIIKSGVHSDPHVLNALIDMYAKGGCIQEARILFDSVHEKDIVCWNSMISRFAQHGLANESLKVFEMMKAEEIQPNYVTFIGVLSACSHVGLIEEGLCYFNSMKHYFGIEPGMEHYSLVVSLLGRAGRLQEAKEFIEHMPLEPAPIVWRSLLSACREFGDVELGNYAAKLAISLGPKNSGPYVLLSNILASKEMWVDTQNVRKEMDCSGAVKEPGYSWIEVMKEVHVFIAKGREHQLTDTIYSVLDCLTWMIRNIGNALDTECIMLNDGND